MERTRDAITAELERNLSDRAEWDEPPELYAVLLEGGHPVLRRFPTSEGFFQVARPPAVLAALAETFETNSERLRREAPADLIGLAFYFEGWSVADPLGLTTEQRQQLSADMRNHRVHARPDRVEARILCAVDRSGIRYSCRQLRGHDIDSIAYGPGDGVCADGTIPDALDRMLQAWLGVTIGPVGPSSPRSPEAADHDTPLGSRRHDGAPKSERCAGGSATPHLGSRRPSH
ncbi:hypothetical protein [Nocardia transvalensis]|uniref:hypothetical protein n=1 Tax=Nocardia transvalensis TaxID=37333 RepID=UPI001894355D|nr:hypothetical protein [Nocardia transvalensis]MBF6333482.1 hypothetical protein [Nocardia transvalensis]